MARANFPTGALDERDPTHGYVFATVTAKQIFDLLDEDEYLARASRMPRLVLKLWADHVVSALLVDSIPTVKANAAHTSFAALGEDIVWAVIDSGVERHPHFESTRICAARRSVASRLSRQQPVDLAINALARRIRARHARRRHHRRRMGRHRTPLAATRARDAKSRLVSYVITPVQARSAGSLRAARSFRCGCSTRTARGARAA